MLSGDLDYLKNKYERISACIKFMHWFLSARTAFGNWPTIWNPKITERPLERPSLNSSHSSLFPLYLNSFPLRQWWMCERYLHGEKWWDVYLSLLGGDREGYLYASTFVWISSGKSSITSTLYTVYVFWILVNDIKLMVMSRLAVWLAELDPNAGLGNTKEKTKMWLY